MFRFCYLQFVFIHVSFKLEVLVREEPWFLRFLINKFCTLPVQIHLHSRHMLLSVNCVCLHENPEPSEANIILCYFNAIRISSSLYIVSSNVKVPKSYFLQKNHLSRHSRNSDCKIRERILLFFSYQNDFFV